MSNVKIGILSDTHRRVDLQKEAIKKLKKESAQYLLHLGDIRLEENLKQLEESNLPYRVVYGNHDRALKDLENRYFIRNEPYYLKIKDITIKMMHLPYYLSPDCDIVLFGHLHKFSVEFKGKTLFLNPGEICARNKNLSECALIEVSKDKYIVNYYYREPEVKEWEVKEFEFMYWQSVSN